MQAQQPVGFAPPPPPSNAPASQLPAQPRPLPGQPLPATQQPPGKEQNLSPTLMAHPGYATFMQMPAPAQALQTMPTGTGGGGGGGAGSGSDGVVKPQGKTAPQQTNPRTVTRTTVACLRCRRGKQKCVNDGFPPCQACVARGCQDECTLGERGKSSEDRAPRAPRKRRAEEDIDYAHITGGGPVPSATLPTTTSRGPSSRRGSLSAGEGSPPAAASALYAMSHSGKRRMSMGACQEDEEDEEMVPTLSGSGFREKVLEQERDEREKEVLPPLPLLLEGCEAYFSTYFQLSFLHRPSFVHKLSTTPEQISPFLLLAMLSVSARFAEGLVRRHGTPSGASAFYAEKAMNMVLGELVSPTLERVQGLYMLAISDFGHGNAFRSRMFQSLARQMAEPLKLHTEIPQLSVVDNEVRRRTFWFLTMDANLLNAVGSSSGPFDPLVVPVQLPSQENDFTFGVDSRVKQYIAGSASEEAKAHPPIAGEVSLLSALLGVISIFGRTARAISASSSSPTRNDHLTLPPWHPDSLLQTTLSSLSSFLATLSPVQQWSTQALLAYRTQNQDLGFLSIHADVYAVNILLRRAYLPQMIRALAPAGAGEGEAGSTQGDDTGIGPPEGREAFYSKMAEELVDYAFRLVSAFEEVTSLRPNVLVTPHLAFCTFLAGTILNYLRLCPWLSPTRAPQARRKLASMLAMLQHIATIWPLAQRWHQNLYTSVTTRRAQLAQDPEEAAGIAQADLAADQEAGLYRQFAPDTPSTMAESSPAHQLDAASALAALAQEGHVQALQHQPNGSGPASPSSGGAAAQKRFSAHLRQAAMAPTTSTPSLASPSLSHLAPSSSVSTASTIPYPSPALASGTPTPFSLFSLTDGEDEKSADGASGNGVVSDLDALLALDMGDMTELNRFLVGWGAFATDGMAVPL
ncbi:hypothetical protein JCM11251_006192 [Rhodosporidiobolus azoricus]